MRYFILHEPISVTVAANANVHHHCTIVLIAAFDLGLCVLWIIDGVLR
jgi:hypothetical protein